MYEKKSLIQKLCYLPFKITHAKQTCAKLDICWAAKETKKKTLNTVRIALGFSFLFKEQKIR